MSNSRFQNLHEILRNYNFNIDNEISHDLICTICNRIIIDARNAPCGCRYCLECITVYLNNEEKFCPRDIDECKIELLNVNKNIQIDHPMNIKISKSIVKCPEKDCGVRDELRKLLDHIRVCNSSQTDCPFSNMGCTNVKIADNKIGEHLLSENVEHSKMLMNCIDIMRNEIDLLKINVSEVKLENENLKRKFEEMKLGNENLEKEIDEMKDEMKSKQVVNDELRAVIALQSKDIANLKRDWVGVKSGTRSMGNKINTFSQKMENVKVSNLEMKTNAEKQICDMSKLQTRVSEIEQLNIGEFVWKIDNFSDRRKQAQDGIETDIFSDAFYTHKNGYKMCLRAYPDGLGNSKSVYMSVGFCVMRGPFDNILQWPCKRVVTLSVVNQQTSLDHYGYTIKYDDCPNNANWRKPTTENNNGYGRSIRLDDLLNDAALCKNDEIFIRCTVR